MTQPITIRKYSKDNCAPCKMVSAYLNSQADFIAEQAITIEEIDVINDLTEAERGKLPFASVPVLEFYRNGALMATSRGVTIPEEFRDCVQIAKEAK